MKTQAMGWLAAAVLAAGLNANYHQGGMPWAHRIANRVVHNSEAVLALATGHADQFLAEAQVVNAQDEVSSCRLQSALARVQSRIARSEARFDRFDDRMQAREESQAARIEAQRARIEAQIAKIRIPAVAMNPVVVRTPRVDVCPRIHVSVPRIPAIRIPATPVVHLNLSDAGTI
jgi:hypothetical protein